MKDFSTWRSRCHNLGNIIPKPKGRGGHETAIKDIWVNDRYGIENRIYSKYLDKGIACESQGIDMLKKVFYPNDYISKNKKLFNDDKFIFGTPDVFTESDNCITDIKNAWNHETFEKAELTWEYTWQLNAYAKMTGAKKCRLFYCLNSMPDFMVSEIEMKEMYAGRYGSTENPEFQILCEKIRQENNYDHIPIQERFKVWEWEPTSLDFETIEKYVIEARQFMANLEKEKEQEIQKNLKYFVK